MGPSLNWMFASKLRPSFCFLNSATSTEPAVGGGQQYAEGLLISTRNVQSEFKSSFKSTNGSKEAPRCSSQGPAGAVLAVEVPPLKAAGLVAHRLQFQFVLFTILCSWRYKIKNICVWRTSRCRPFYFQALARTVESCVGLAPLGVLQSGNLYFFSPPVLFSSPPFLTSLTSTVFLQNVKTREVGVLNVSSAPRTLISTPCCCTRRS